MSSLGLHLNAVQTNTPEAAVTRPPTTRCGNFRSLERTDSAALCRPSLVRRTTRQNSADIGVFCRRMTIP